MTRLVAPHLTVEANGVPHRMHGRKEKGCFVGRRLRRRPTKRRFSLLFRDGSPTGSPDHDCMQSYHPAWGGRERRKRRAPGKV